MYPNRLYAEKLGSVLFCFYVMVEAEWISGCVSERVRELVSERMSD